MIAFPSRCSTAEPSTFMATSQVPLPTPNRNRPITTGSTLTDWPMPAVTRPAAAINAITVIVRAAPRRETTRPASGIEMTDPIAIASSTRPSWRGESSRLSRTCGIREAQLANAKPLRMKTA